MPNPPLKTALFWSGGKDAAYALYLLKKDPHFQVDFLVTTINEEKQEASMHKVPLELIQAQADALGIPLVIVPLPEMPSALLYEHNHRQALQDLKEAHKIECIAFGDIFLEDLRTYREELFKPLELELVYPLWKKDTQKLSKEIIDEGIKALTVCTDAKILDESYLGKSLDTAFLNALPAATDPCGENGEFHTFVYDGPMFNHPVPYTCGKKRLQKYELKSSEVSSAFWYLEVKK